MRERRGAVALAAGVLAGLLTLSHVLGAPPETARDFTYFWRAATALAGGENPYDVIRPTGAYPYNGIFPYPLTAGVVLLPFAWLPPQTGAALFVGTGFALAAYGLLGLAPWRLLALLSVPALWATTWVQWGPLLLGAALVPGFGLLLAVKPTIGAALFLYRPTRAAFWGGLALAAVAVLLLPTWPFDWLATLQADPHRAQYRPPLLMPGGIVFLLAVLRWRRPEGRLLAMMACVPQNAYFENQLPLLLVPDRWWSLALYVAWTHGLRHVAETLYPIHVIPDTGLRSLAWEPIVMWGMYLPALVMVMLRRNEGTVSAWLERAASRAPRWLRGAPAPEPA